MLLAFILTLLTLVWQIAIERKNMSKLTDEEKENEFFKEDNSDKKLGPILALVCVVFLLVAGAVVLFIINRQVENDPNKNIIAAVEESSSPTPTEETLIIDRTDEVPSPTVEETSPSPTVAPSLEPLEFETFDGEPLPFVKGAIMENDVKDFSKVKYDVARNLSEMEAYFEDNNLQALSDLAHLDRYIAMSYYYRDTTDFAYFGDVNAEGRPDGKGIAVYADNQYYCGEWADGVRQGSGVWIHYHIHLKENLTDAMVFHQFIGNFSNDLPNGEGQDHYEFDPVLMVKNSWYITNYMGNFTNGKIDGEFYCTAINKEGNYSDYTGNASNGSFEYVSESRDKRNRGPVLTDTQNPDSSIWLSKEDNTDIGVINYISGKN